MGRVLIGLSAVALFFAAVAGWVMNLFKIFSATEPGEIIIRVIGAVLFLIGAIIGWF